MKKRTRILSACLAVLLLVGSLGIYASEVDTRAVKMPFEDVAPTAWYCAEVSYAYAVGLVSGMTPTKYMPDRNVTRGQFITMLGRMLMPSDYRPSAQAPRFTDVVSGSYYEIYVLWASEAGIVKGITETTFEPEREIRRQDMATLLYRAQQLELAVILPFTASAVTFNDASSIADYAYDAIRSLQRQGLLKGDNHGNVNPRKSLTRAEAAAILSRYHAAARGHVHNYVRGGSVAATCTTSSYIQYSCSCGSYYGEKTGNALGHSYAAPKFDAANRRYVYTCTRCGYITYKNMPAKRLYNGASLLKYDDMVKYLNQLQERYPDLIKISSAGKSVRGVNIPVVEFGKGSRYIFFNGNLHAREYITTNYLVDVLDEYAYAYVKGTKIGSYDIKPLLDSFKLVIIPCLNPDGRAMAIAGNYYYKANANGVDLNSNFPTNWSYKSDGSAGTEAGSEPETKAVLSILGKYRFELCIDCHTAGNVIYYSDNDVPATLDARSYALAQALSWESGFGLYKYGSTPGMANYARHPYGCPGFTVEMWPTLEHPIDCSGYYEKVWDRLNTMPAIAMNWMRQNRDVQVYDSFEPEIAD